jgi:hypothetical protein
MGLSTIEVGFLKNAMMAGLLPSGGHILELGESSLIPADAGEALLSLVAAHIPVSRRQEAWRRMVSAMRSKTQYQRNYGAARGLYHAIFEPESYIAIDLDCGPRRFCLDLNGRVSLHKQFDCVINNGTSEHIFDQANVFRLMHDHTRPGGVMVHWTPCLGWINHGLYNIQPGLLFDLAAANNYDIDLIGFASASEFVPLQSGSDYASILREHQSIAHGLLCGILRKTIDRPFIPPTQGAYLSQAESGAMRLAQMPRRVLPQARKNLALHRPALQSSTSEWSWHDDPATDAAGGNNGQITGFYGFHTEQETRPWWMVDLGSQLRISEVVVYNRMDAPGSMDQRAARLCILLSDDGERWHSVYSRTEREPFGGADGTPLRIALGDEAARYVRLTLPGEGVLHLDEVEVYGH